MLDPTSSGKCALCRYSRVIRSQRGSVFSLCKRAESDSAYVRYPILPVLDCSGFESRGESSEKRDG